MGWIYPTKGTVKGKAIQIKGSFKTLAKNDLEDIPCGDVFFRAFDHALIGVGRHIADRIGQALKCAWLIVKAHR